MKYDWLLHVQPFDKKNLDELNCKGKLKWLCDPALLKVSLKNSTTYFFEPNNLKET